MLPGSHFGLIFGAPLQLIPHFLSSKTDSEESRAKADVFSSWSIPGHTPQDADFGEEALRDYCS